MSRRKLYVHVGPMKTGTTAIQTFLREHDDAVLIYPKSYLFAGAHHNLVFNFFGDRRVGLSGVTDVSEHFEEIRALTKDNSRDVLISSEALVPMAWQPRRVDPGALIRAIIPYIGTPTPEVEILVACREHFSWAASAYNHTLKGNAKWDPDEFLGAYSSALCFAPIIRSMEESGFRVTVLNYHPSLSWVERFLTHVGFSAQMLPRTQAMNVSMSPAGMIMKLAANRALPGEETSRKLRRKLRNLPEFGTPSQFIFGAEAAKVAECFFSEDRRILSEKFAIELPRPDLNSPSMFFVTAQDLAAIETLAGDIGVDGPAILGVARQFLRSA
ncbi:MAG TPA: hypothetical protein VNX86_11675 [Rhizomicrobium sp.]|nr:hypothetical protein [Rhizomicrobium sp.]